jgi:plasmid stabilization system protein ParE
VKLVPHPLLERDIIGMAEHVFDVTGDAEAARRRLAEARELIGDIMREPALGSRLVEQAEGWRIRHVPQDLGSVPS